MANKKITFAKFRGFLTKILKGRNADKNEIRAYTAGCSYKDRKYFHVVGMSHYPSEGRMYIALEEDKPWPDHRFSGDPVRMPECEHERMHTCKFHTEGYLKDHCSHPDHFGWYDCDAPEDSPLWNECKKCKDWRLK